MSYSEFRAKLLADAAFALSIDWMDVVDASHALHGVARERAKAESETLTRAAKNQVDIGNTLQNMGANSMAVDHFEEAERLYSKADAVLRPDKAVGHASLAFAATPVAVGDMVCVKGGMRLTDVEVTFGDWTGHAPEVRITMDHEVTYWQRFCTWFNHVAWGD